MVSAEIRTISGNTEKTAGLLVKNPTNFPVKVTAPLHIQAEIANPKLAWKLYKHPGGVKDEEMPLPRIYANNTQTFVWAPGETKAIPIDVVHGLFIQHCMTCAVDRGERTVWRYGDTDSMAGRICGDRSHARVVVGGLAPQLCVVDEDGNGDTVMLDENLQERMAAPAVGLETLHQIVAARRPK